MLVRKCDVCDHIIENENGYLIDIFETKMPRGTEERIRKLSMSLEICSECKEAAFNVLTNRLSKTCASTVYGIMEKKEDNNG